MSKPTLWSACTAQLTSGDFCDAPTLPEAPFPICVHHAAQLYGYLRGRAGQVTGEHDPSEYLVGLLEEHRARVGEARPVVYYVQVGDVIKIGTTIRLPQRLRHYPPFAKLLAFEPGSYDVERERCEQFAEHVVGGREWFARAPDLLAHIAQVAADNREMPAPVPAPDPAFASVTEFAPAPELLDTLVTSVEASELAGVDANTVRVWKHRGQLIPATYDRMGRPLYRFVDVVKAESRTRLRARRTHVA